jgi:hypothetical protein
MTRVMLRKTLIFWGLGKGYVGFGEEVLFLKLFYKSEIISK